MKYILTFLLFCSLAYSQQGGGGVRKITAGTNVTISPASGVGNVTINASGGGSTGNADSLGSIPAAQYQLKADSTIVGVGYGLDRTVANHTQTITVDTTNEIATLFDVSQKINITDSTIIGVGYGLDRTVSDNTQTVTVDTTNEIATLFDVSQKISIVDSAKVAAGYGVDVAYSGHTATVTVDTTNEIATLYDLSQVTGSAMTGTVIADSLQYSTHLYTSYRQNKYFTYGFDDFVSNASNASSTGSMGWAGTVVNSSSMALGSVADSTVAGMITISTGTNVAGAFILNTTNSSHVPGNGLLQFEARVKVTNLPATVGAGGQQYFADIGFGDVVTGGEFTDGLHFRLDSLSTQWKCVVRSNGTADTSSQGSAVVAGTWYKLRADINAYVARFYIDDVLVKTVTSSTAVPNGTARVFGNNVRIVKIGGATARTLDMDWYYWDKTFTATR